VADNASVEIGPITDVQPVTPAQFKNIDTSMLDIIATDKGNQLFQQAQKEYPYLANKDIAFKYSPNPADERMLEFYHPEETERPQYMPAGKVGIEVFSPKASPLDILADYVSHYAVGTNAQGQPIDPKLQALYQQFQNQLSPATLPDRYYYHVKNLGETRPYEQWLESTGLPELFRGYTFKQFGPEEEAKKMYTPEQLKTLDQVRSYLNVK